MADYSYDYSKLMSGDIFVWEGETDVERVVHSTFRAKGSGIGMGQQPPITTIKLIDGTTFGWDPWISEGYYRKFKVIGFEPLTEASDDLATPWLSDQTIEGNKTAAIRISKHSIAKQKALAKLSDADREALGIK